MLLVFITSPKTITCFCAEIIKISILFGLKKRVLVGAVLLKVLFVCAELLRSSQPNGVMSSAVSLPNHTFTGQA